MVMKMLLVVWYQPNDSTKHWRYWKDDASAIEWVNSLREDSPHLAVRKQCNDFEFRLVFDTSKLPDLLHRTFSTLLLAIGTDFKINPTVGAAA
jgi:hypothetical protein